MREKGVTEGLALIVAIWFFVSPGLTSADYSLPGFSSIPRGLTVCIDDFGWQGGSSLDSVGGPWRIGSRDMTLLDYQNIVQVAQNLGIRIHGNWIMSELDRSNICAKPEYNLPVGPSDVTEYGLDWDNSQYVNDSNFILMNYVRDNAAWLEFALHGVRHEHWEGGVRTRAEWAPSVGSYGWDDMDMHARCFEELLRQYYTEEECSFPIGFMAPGWHYYYNTSSTQTTGALLHDYGVKYAYLNFYEPVIDNGVLLLSRIRGLLWWEELAVTPQEYPSEVVSIESHPPNWFGAFASWESYLRGINDDPHRYLPKNEVQNASQWLYRQYASINDSPGHATIDNTGMIGDVYTYDLLGTLVLKTALYGNHISSATIDKGAQIVGYYEDEHGYGYLIIGHESNPMGRLTRDVFTLTYTVGAGTMSSYIDMKNATFNVHSFTTSASGVEIKMEIYGTQNVIVKLDGFEPAGVISYNPDFVVNSYSWNAAVQTLTINVTGTDMQGEIGELTVSGRWLLSIEPVATTVIPGETVHFAASHGTMPYMFSLWQDESGATLIDNGDGTADYTAGDGLGTDMVRVTDGAEAARDATVMVISGRCAPIPLPYDGADCDSEVAGYECDKAIDGNPATIWHTPWGAGTTNHPHEIVIDLPGDSEFMVCGFRYLPRQDGENGRIDKFEFCVSENGVDWVYPVILDNHFLNTQDEQERLFDPIPGRYVKLLALSEVNENPWTSVAELIILGYEGTLSLSIEPVATTVIPGETVHFAASHGTMPYRFSLWQDDSGATLIDNGDGTADYTAGDGLGTDVVRVTDGAEAARDATVMVISGRCDPISLPYYGADCDSEAPGYECEKAIDGNPATIWHTSWGYGTTYPPHEIVIQLPSVYQVCGIRYLPRQYSNPLRDWDQNGRIDKFDIYVSEDGVSWNQADIFDDTFDNSADEQERVFDSIPGRYVKLLALSEVNENPWTSVAELIILGYEGTLPLSIEPVATTVIFGETVHFVASHGTMPYMFSLWQDESGATLIDNGDGTADYTAGDGLGTDVVQVTDGAEAARDATVMVISGRCAPIPLPYDDGADCDSEAAGYECDKAIDGNPATIWHTPWGAGTTNHPHEIVIDLPGDSEFMVCGFRYLPRQDGENGRIDEFEFCVSENGVDWVCPVIPDNHFLNTQDEQERLFDPIPGRYVKLVALSEVNENPWTSIAELTLMTAQQ